MVQVQSTWFPLYDRNPQTFVPNIFFAKPEDFRKATQRVFHSSFVELPVVSRAARAMRAGRKPFLRICYCYNPVMIINLTTSRLPRSNASTMRQVKPVPVVLIGGHQASG